MYSCKMSFVNVSDATALIQKKADMVDGTIVGYNIKPIIDIERKGVAVNKRKDVKTISDVKERVLGLWLHILPDNGYIQYDFVFQIDRFFIDYNNKETIGPFKRFKIKKEIKDLELKIKDLESKRLLGYKAIITKPDLASYLYHLGVNDLSELSGKRVKLSVLPEFDEDKSHAYCGDMLSYVPMFCVQLSDEFKDKFKPVCEDEIMIAKYFNFKNRNGSADNYNLLKDYYDLITKYEKNVGKHWFISQGTGVSSSIRRIDPNILYDPLHFEYDFEKNIEF